MSDKDKNQLDTQDMGDKSKDNKDNKDSSKSKNTGKKGKRGFTRRGKDGKQGRIGNQKFDNDLSWYTQTATLLKPVTKISMIPLHGMDFYIDIHNKKYDKVGSVPTNIPGIAITKYAPIIPVKAKSDKFDFGDDVFTTAGKTLFAQLRQVLNGVRPYNTPDLLSYIILVGSITAYMEHLRRTYNMVFYTNPLSRYSREFLVDGVGTEGDYKYLVKSGPEFISRFNAIALKLRNLLVPMGLPIVSRWKWLNTYMFADANVLKPQLIIPKPTGFYSLNYSRISPDKPYTLEYLNLDSKSIWEALDKIEDAVNEILQNDIISVINADLIRAFGNTNVVHTPMIIDNIEFSFSPVYSEEFIIQWQHHTPINRSPLKYHIELNNKTSEFEMKLQLVELEDGFSNLSSCLLTTNNDELTMEEVTMKTRMMTLYNKDSAGVEHYTFGSEIWGITKLRQFGFGDTFLYSNTFDMRKDLTDDGTAGDVTAQPYGETRELRLLNFLRTYARLSVFENPPVMYLLDVESPNDDSLTETGNDGLLGSVRGTVLGSINNYGVISYNTLKFIQTAALTSLVGLSDVKGIQSVLEAKKNHKA